MRKSLLPFFIFLFLCVLNLPAQSAGSVGGDPINNISTELSKIGKSVQTLNDRMKAFVDKFEKVGSMSLTEKQLDIVFGLELLIRAEQLIAGHQKSQIELTEKLNESRTKLAQVEIDLRPRSIDRSIAMIGTTDTDELRDNKRMKLQAERQSLVQLLSQIQENLAENNDKLRSAQILANNLRRQYLPQIDKEIYKQ